MRRKLLGQHFTKITGAIACAVSLGSFASFANAQGFGLDGIGSVSNLLEQIGQLQSSAGSRVNSKSPVDRARAEAEKDAGLSDSEDRFGRQRDEFTEGDLENLLNQYCIGSPNLDERELRIAELDLSRLEADYCRRAKEVLRQYGYDIFSAVVEAPRLTVGAVADDYILGIGDELIVSIHGDQPSTITTSVDREGRVILPNLPPMSAAGRRFEQFRRELQARTSASMLGAQVFVSLANVRLLSVMVVGEVGSPGIHQITGLSSVVDALNAAGGINPTGSLRRVQVHRADEIFWVDLYDLMFSTGASHHLGIMDGDRIVVPTIGPTVAVSGDVKRPAIYELSEGQRSALSKAILEFAGGPLRPRGNRFVQISFQDSGGQLVVEHAAGERFSVGDGDILMVQRRQDIQSGTVELLGHVRVPGQRSLASVKTVSGLIPSSAAFEDNPYLPFAILETTDEATHSRRLFPVDLQQILDGAQDFTLREFDRLIVLSAEDVRYLSSPDVQEIIFLDETAGLFPAPEEKKEPTPTFQPQAGGGLTGLLSGAASLGVGSAPAPQRPSTSASKSEKEESRDKRADDDEEAELRVCDGLVRLGEIVRGGRSGRFANAVRLIDRETEENPSARLPCPEIFNTYGNLLPFALEHVVAANGEVRRPGAYPVAGETPLASVIAVAGGLTREVDLTRLEISRFDPDPYKGLSDTSRKIVDLNALPVEKIAVSPGDVVRFNPVFTDRDSGPVVLTGEFVRPGIYGIRRGETLAEVIRRAGGLTEQAYPYGAFFLRERVRQVEQQGFARASRELSSSLAVAAVRRGVDPAALVSLQQISDQLGKVQAIGRIVIEADPTVLQVRRELDTVLEPGDRVFVPKRPNFVSVLGDVLNPGAQQFIPGTKADEYIRQSGGFQRSADEDRVFVVFPNGRAQPLSLSAWNYSPVQIPPGSTIVVPQDPIPFDLFTFATELTDLVSKVALTAASLSVLANN